MHFFNWLRPNLGTTTSAVFLAGIIIAATACGTPTLSPLSPTLARPSQATPVNAPTALPTLETLQGAATPTVPVTPTVPANPTPTRAPKPTATSVPPTPKPAALSGRIAYGVVFGAAPKFHTIWIANVDGSGAHQVLANAEWPALSPDGSRLAYFGVPEGGSRGLYIANSDGGNPQGPLVISPGVCCLHWSRDGKWVVYADSPKPLQPGGPISMLKIDGSYKTIVSLNVAGNGPAFSPDGKHVVYSGCLPNTNTCGVLIVTADGSGAIQKVTTDYGGNADWSSRSDKIVYQAHDSAGHMQVYVVNVDGSGKKQLTSGKSNDGQPAWSRDGGSIFWRSDQNGTAWAVFVMNADGSNPRRILDQVPPEPDLWGWESLSVGP